LYCIVFCLAEKKVAYMHDIYMIWFW